MEKVLLFGNGLNLLNQNLSWKTLLSNVQVKDEVGLAVHDSLDLVDVPYPLQYDYLLLSSDFRKRVHEVKDSTGWKKVIEDRQFALKKAICEELKAFSPMLSTGSWLLFLLTLILPRIMTMFWMRL